MALRASTTADLPPAGVTGLAFNAYRRDLATHSFPPALPHALESLAGPGCSNVCVRAFMLVSGHPGSTTAEIVSSLTPILKAGVTSFVCLQPEMPRPWSTNTPAAHAHGQAHTHAQSNAHANSTGTRAHSVATTAHMRSAYAGGNVVTAKNYMPDAQAMVDAGGFPQSGGRPLGFVHFPIPETGGGTVPDEVLKPFLLDLIGYMRAGEMMLLHDGVGAGRAGVVAASVLGLVYGLSSSEALDLMQRSRNDRPGGGGALVDTHEQKMQVHRVLADGALRAAARAVAPKLVDSVRDDANAALVAVTEKVRGVLARKGTLSAVYLRRYAATLADARGALTRAAFDRLAADAEWHLTAHEAETLWSAASRTAGAAQPDVASLWRVIRGLMNPRRAAAVHDVFRRLAGGNGYISMERLAAAFHAETHPDVRATRRTAEEVRNEFHDTFGIAGRSSGAHGATKQVSAEDFETYYADISAAVNDDATFEILIFGCWPAKDGLSTKYAERAGLTSSGSAATGEGQVLTSGGTRPNRYPQTTSEAASLAVAQEAARALPLPDSQLAAALQTKRSTSMSRTEHGLELFDLSDPKTAIAAARAYAISKSDMVLPALYGTLRVADNDADGCIDAREFATAWREAGAPLSAADCDALYGALAARLSGQPARELDLARVRLPLEDAHAALRDHPLNDARHSAVLSAFNMIDRETTGAINVGRLMLAFNAEAHPNVTTQKASLEMTQRLATYAVAAAAKLVDARGPAVRAAGSFGTPAGAAYYGVGDGCMRLPFFTAVNEALSAAYDDDTAFAIVVARLWSGGASGRKGRAVGDPDRGLQAKEAPDGFLSSMERLSGPGTTAGNRSYARGNGYATMTGSKPLALQGNVSSPSAFHSGDTAAGLMGAGEPFMGTPARGRPATAAAPPADAHPDAYDPFIITRGDRGKRHVPAAEASLRYSSPYTVGRAASPAGSVVSVATRTVGGVRPGYVTVQGPAGAMDVHEFRTSGSADVDAILNIMRTQLLRRGARAMFSMIRQFEAVSASVLRLPFGELRAPLPLAAFLTVVRDASLGVSARQLDQVVAYLDPSASGAIAPARFVALLRGGELSPSRREVVERAYFHLRAIAAQQSLDAAQGDDLSADDVHFGYKSVNHPDVRASKRSEDEVLREFLETFAGSTFVTPDGRVQLDGFLEYYATVSAFVGDDTAFSMLLYDTWELYAEDRAGLQGGRTTIPSSWKSATGSGMAGPAAGKPTNVAAATHVADTINDLPGIAGAWSPEHRLRTRDFQASAGGSRAEAAHLADVARMDWHAAPRGHGLERKGYGYKSEY